MARYGSADVGFILFDGMSVLGQITMIDISKEAVLEETTVLGSADASYAPVGLKRGMLSQKGFYDDTANGINTALVGLLQRVACIALEPSADGNDFIGWAGAIAAKYKRLMTRDELHKAEAEYQVTGAVEDGKIIHRHFAETSDPYVSGTHIDNGASSANGASGYMQCSALTLGGFTNVIFKIRHSTDNVAFSDLITFTAVTAAPTAQRLTVAGTINRYTRAEYDFTGAGAGQSVTFMLGLARN